MNAKELLNECDVSVWERRLRIYIVALVCIQHIVYLVYTYLTHVCCFCTLIPLGFLYLILLWTYILVLVSA